MGNRWKIGWNWFLKPLFVNSCCLESTSDMKIFTLIPKWHPTSRLWHRKISRDVLTIRTFFQVYYSLPFIYRFECIVWCVFFSRVTKAWAFCKNFPSTQFLLSFAPRFLKFFTIQWTNKISRTVRILSFCKEIISWQQTHFAGFFMLNIYQPFLRPSISETKIFHYWKNLTANFQRGRILESIRRSFRTLN